MRNPSKVQNPKSNVVIRDGRTDFGHWTADIERRTGGL